MRHPPNDVFFGYAYFRERLKAVVQLRRISLPRTWVNKGPGLRRLPRRRFGSVPVQVTLALPETHGARLALRQAEQAVLVVEVQVRVPPVEHHEHLVGRYTRARDRRVLLGP